MATCYIVQESDGTSRFILEDGSGFLVLEDCVPTAAGDSVMGGTAAQAQAQALAAQQGQQAILKRRRLEADEEDFAFLLTEL